MNSIVNEQVTTPNYVSDNDTSTKAKSEDCVTTKSEENIHNPELDNGATRGSAPPPTLVTYEYLHNNFTKPQLQEYCRNLGMIKIWTTKDKLIEKF